MNVSDPTLTRDDDHVYRVGAELAGPSITQQFALCGITDNSFMTAEHYSRGRAVHRAIELFELGKLRWDSLTDAIKPYLDGYVDFKAHTGFVPFRSFIEWAFFHPTLRYPGQIDIFGRVGEEFWLPDFKSGTVSWWVGMQTWMQEQGVRTVGLDALREELGVAAPLDPLKGVRIKRFALRLKGSGRLKYDLKPFENDARDGRLAMGVIALTQEMLAHGGDGWLRKLNKQMERSR